LDRLEDELFFAVAEKPRQKNMAELKQPESSACSKQTSIHPGRSVTPGNLLDKPRLLIGFCLQPNVTNDERRKSRSECIRDPRDYGRTVGQHQAVRQGKCRA